MLHVQQRPSSGESQDIDAAGKPPPYCAPLSSLIFTSARDELARHKRQLRRAEGSKKQYADETQNVIRRQKSVIRLLPGKHRSLDLFVPLISICLCPLCSRDMIKALEAENVDLKKNLSLAASPQNDQKVACTSLSLTHTVSGCAGQTGELNVSGSA